ncbi:hypothetical protein Tco_0389233, partial [Tanacetum coccineum]
VLWWDGESFAKFKEYGGGGNGESFAHVSAGVVKGVHWWRRMEKVVVGRRRHDGVMVVDDGESELKSGY